jgi:hypothetical protein
MHNMFIATLFMALVVAPAFAALSVFDDRPNR